MNSDDESEVGSTDMSLLDVGTKRRTGSSGSKRKREEIEICSLRTAILVRNELRRQRMERDYNRSVERVLDVLHGLPGVRKWSAFYNASVNLLLANVANREGFMAFSSPEDKIRFLECMTRTNNIFENEAELLEKDKLSINYHNRRSWHLGVETSNIIDFDTVPANCKDFVEDYLTTSKQYQADSKTVCKEAYFYAKGLALKNDTVNVWIFDLDDTLLSSIPFYAKYGFGTEKTPRGAYWKWLESGASTPGLPETLILYKNLLELGVEPILVTERWTTLEEVTLKNLKAAGFTYWKHLLFKPKGSNVKEVVYKSKARENLVRRGYNIIGNIGDQWADLVENTPGRVFKLPNPLYYVPS